MVYGRPPFAHLNLYKKLMHIPDPKYPIAYPSGVCQDPLLLNVLHHCLQRDAAKRPTISGKCAIGMGQVSAQA